MGIVDGAVWITTLTRFHAGGCVCNVIGAVSVRATQLLIEAFEPGLVLQMIDTYQGNAMTGEPTVPAALMRRFEDQLRAPFTIVFGHTERSPVASMTGPTTASKTRPTPSVGRCRMWR